MQRIIHLFPYFGIFLLFECPYSSTFLVIVLFALHTYFDPIMYQVKRGTVFDSFVISALLQYVHFLQRKYSLNSFNLLGHTAPAQAGSLLLVGPFVDYLLTGQRVDHFVFFISCSGMDKISTMFLSLRSYGDWSFLRVIYLLRNEMVIRLHLAGWEFQYSDGL